MSDARLKFLLPALSILLLMTLLLGVTGLVSLQLIFLISVLLALLLLGATWDFSRRAERREQEAEVMISRLREAYSIYLSVYLLDLKQGTYIEIRSNPLLRSLLESTDAPIAEKLSVVMVKMSSPEFLKSILDFTNLYSLPGRLAGKKTITQEFFGTKSGWCRARFVSMDGDENSECTRVIFAVEEINEEKRREKELVEQAERDLMTGVLNRGTGEKKISDLLMLGVKGMFCLIDMDSLKHINDTYGHLAGDAAINCLADSLKRSFREEDLVMRYGGDEFVVFAPGITEEALGGKIMDRLLNHMKDRRLPELGNKSVSISVGAVLIGSAISSFAELIRQADENVYLCKQQEGAAYKFVKLPE